MKRDRGEYRPIYKALWDGASFQVLAPNSRLTLLALKGVLPGCGLGVITAHRDSLAAWTGLSGVQVTWSLKQLIEHEWIQIEAPLIWVVRGFEFEPSWDHTNINQRKHIQHYIGTLPRRPIVDRWCVHYAEWFGAVPSSPAGPNGQGPSPPHT